MKKSPFQTVFSLERGALQSNSLGVFDSVVVILLYLAVYMIFINWIIGINFQNKYIESVVYVMAVVIFYTIVLIIFTKCFCYKTDLIYENRLTQKKVIYSIALTFGCFFFSVFLFKLAFKYIDYETYVKAMKISFSNIRLVICFVCFIGPFAEELIYRGIVLNGLAKNYSQRKSIVISAVLFGIGHLNITQFIMGFFLGIILGVIYLRFNSLILCMIVHSINNSISTLMATVTNFTYLDSIKNQSLIAAFIFGMVGLSAILYFYKLLKKEDEKTLVQIDL